MESSVVSRVIKARACGGRATATAAAGVDLKRREVRREGRGELEHRHRRRRLQTSVRAKSVVEEHTKMAPSSSTVSA